MHNKLSGEGKMRKWINLSACLLACIAAVSAAHADQHAGDAHLVLTVPAAVTSEATGPLTATAIGQATAVDDDGKPVKLSNDAPASFPVGSTTVIWTAWEEDIDHGVVKKEHVTTATQLVTITDTTPPSITIQQPTITIEATAAQTPVTLGTVTAIDLVDGAITPSSDAPATFPVGITTVTYTATDGAGNTTTATQTVTVADTTPPVLTVQNPGITVEATATQMTVSLGTVAATDLVDGPLTPVNNAPATFPLGITTVTWTATDAAGNSATAQQQVTVQDTTPPTITAPAAVSADSNTGQPIAVSIGTATATDIFIPVTITSNAPAAFPIGDTTVIWTATDANGNSVTDTQLVTVVDTSVLANLPPDPGDAGKATLEGIDSDGDGVRDDVQRWIAITYPDSEKTRAALTQRTKTMQQFVLAASDPTASINLAVKMGKDRSCLAYIRSQDFYDIAIEQKAIFLNTYERSKAWLTADKHLSGHMFSGLPYSQRKLGCDFNPDLMAN